MDVPLIISTFGALLVSFLPVFTRPSQRTFLTLASAWVMAAGPRTVTNLIRAAASTARKSHDAYQYFFSNASWCMDRLWKILLRLIVATLAPEASVWLVGDDTLLHHSGRRIFGAGVFRDAVRSTRKVVAYAFGHNWVLLCVVVRVPFLTTVHLALPVLARLRPKAPKKARKAAREPTTVDLLAEMVRKVADWLPDRCFVLVADGAYACLAGRLPSNVVLISRMRKDAALFGPRPPRTGKAGRPRNKGRRLPTPARVAARRRTRWTRARLVLYGEEVDRLVHCFDALWYEVSPDRPVRVVCVRDPSGKGEDTFLFTTDLAMTPEEIITGYTARWSIEVTFRESKQSMGVDGPQARREEAVRRQAPFGFFMLSLVKLWYLTRGHRLTREHGKVEPWYAHKQGASYADMLAVLRRASWNAAIPRKSGLERRHAEILGALIASASRAA